MVFYHDNRKLRQQSRFKWLVDWVRADQTLMYACAHTWASMCLCVSTESCVYELMFAWTEAKRGSGCPPVSLSTVFFLRQCLSFNLEPGWFLASLGCSCNAGVTGLCKAMHSCLHVFWNVIPSSQASTASTPTNELSSAPTFLRFTPYFPYMHLSKRSERGTWRSGLL